MTMIPVEEIRDNPTLVLGTESGGETSVIDANALVTGRTCVIGASGSGKSYAVGVLCEELCKSKIPFAIIDTEGEHFGLKEQYDVIWVGDEQECDLQWTTFDSSRLATEAPDIAPLILDVSETADSKARVSDFLRKLYEEIERRRTPYLVIVEEADKFMPQDGDCLPIFNEIARRGRKRGLGLVVCTQRPSLINKNILSQCGNQLIGRLTIQNDLKSVAQFFSTRGMRNSLTNLPAGTFYVMGGLSTVSQRVAIREKETRSGGMTPKLASRTIKPLDKLSVKAPTRARNQAKGQFHYKSGVGWVPSVSK